MSGYSLNEIGSAVLFWLVVSIPVVVTMWAFLDVARRPSWVWALAGRSRLLWLCLLGMTLPTVLGGVIVALVYFFGVRRELTRTELGDIS